MDKKQTAYLKSFLQWIGINTAWDVLKFICSSVYSAFQTWYLSTQPNFTEWLSSMNISTVFAFAGMFLGFAVIANKIITFVSRFVFSKIPFSKLALSASLLKNNEVRLIIKNGIFRKPQLMISKIEIGISGKRNWLSVIHNNSVLKFLQSVEVPFIKLNPTDNTFSIIYPDNEVLEKFCYGSYKFDVVIQYGYSTPREGLLSRYEVVVEFGSGVLKIVSLQASAT